MGPDWLATRHWPDGGSAPAMGLGELIQNSLKMLPNPLADGNVSLNNPNAPVGGKQDLDPGATWRGSQSKNGRKESNHVDSEMYYHSGLAIVPHLHCGVSILSNH